MSALVKHAPENLIGARGTGENTRSACGNAVAAQAEAIMEI